MCIIQINSYLSFINFYVKASCICRSSHMKTCFILGTWKLSYPFLRNKLNLFRPMEFSIKLHTIKSG